MSEKIKVLICVIGFTGQGHANAFRYANAEFAPEIYLHLHRRADSEDKQYCVAEWTSKSAVAAGPCPRFKTYIWLNQFRAAGVSFEDRPDLLGHRSERITTHYSASELGNLLTAANRVVRENSRKTSALFILKKNAASAMIR